MQIFTNLRGAGVCLPAGQLVLSACFLSLSAGAAPGVFSVHAQERVGAAPALPTLRLIAPQARQSVELRRIQVDAQIAGLAGATRIEFEVYNPNDLALEAELEFPLLEGQSVTGFALDINGEMRPAVPVPKAKGQQVFEDVTRTRIDPALLEVTQGQNYKLRIYPLPAHGTRRVVLDITESVHASAAPLWRLPLRFAGTVKALDINVRVAGLSAKELSARLGARRLALRDEAGGARLTLTQSGYRPNEELQVSLPRTATKTALALQSFGGQTYFYAEVTAPQASAPRPPPRRVALLWDASGSGAQRDHGRELALLDAYFQSLGALEVVLVAVRDVAQPPETFTVTNGQWAELRQRLQTLPYDGATNLSALKAPAGAQLALLFSDGIGTYGDAPLPASDIPLFALTASAGTDSAALRRTAETSGGQLLDLLATAPADAVKTLKTESTRLLALHATGARDLEYLSSYPEGGRLAISGVLTDPEANVVLELATPGGMPKKITLHVAGAPREGGSGVAAHRWAAMRLARLEADAERNQSAILRLGTEMRMLTRQTSLIVLDSVADYARYGIEPPESLRAEWQTLLARTKEADAQAKARHLERIAAQFQTRVKWWEQDFPKDSAPVVKPPADAPMIGEQLTAPAMARLAPAPVAAPIALPSPERLAAREAVEARVSGAQRKARQETDSAPSSIQLRKWVPDEPYARRLRAAKEQDLYAIYLDERPAYLSSSAFYLDVADLLFERQQPALAARVLSNLAEMKLENRHLLRILAYRLMLAGRVDQAIPMLKKVLALSPDEPQSHRDLALALAKAGQAQQAIDGLWNVVSRPWNGRFPEIEQIALAELNAIVAAHPGLDTSRMDARLLRNLPLDVRAVLTWDADNTDIDLWVIDPNGEKAFYGHRLTYQGGQMSADFTGGFGPEVFSLKTAKPGKYTVMAQFYGHRQQIVAPATTLMLKLSTGFGTPRQKDEDVVLRLSGQGQEVNVGTFTVGEPVKP
jgi:tetratricopeptide (TPR) repeat protein